MRGTSLHGLAVRHVDAPGFFLCNRWKITFGMEFVICYMFDTFESYLTVGESARPRDVRVRDMTPDRLNCDPLLYMLYVMNNPI